MLDVTQVAQAAEAKAQILVPTPAAAQLPEDTAWSMIYAEGGVLAVLLVVGITALWRVVKKILDESRAQAAQLQATQVEAIGGLKDAVTHVRHAVQISDTNNQAALRHLGDVVSKSVDRLDLHEQKLVSHSEILVVTQHRLATLERVVPASGSYPAVPPQGDGG